MEQFEWYDERFTPYCQAVGFLAVMWAAIEFSLDQAIWELANVEMGAGACITSQMIGPAPRLRALTALIHYRDPDCSLLAEVGTLGERLRKLAAKRNRYVHDSVGIGADTGQIKKIEVTADNRLRFISDYVEIEAIQKLGGEIREANVALTLLKERLFTALPPWPRKQFEASPSGVRLLGPKEIPDQDEEAPEPPPQSSPP